MKPELGANGIPGVAITFNGNGLYANRWIDINMDGLQIFHGDALLPPVAYIYFTAANGANYEQPTIGNLTAIVAPQ